MSIISLASNNSKWRGLDYYENKRVISCMSPGEGVYSSTVKGSGGNSYQVNLDIKHPRKSKCNCPHADGRRVICKHIIATYFTAFPNEADEFLAEVEAYESQEEQREQEEYEDIVRYVTSLSKRELQQELLGYMLEDEEAYEWR